MTSPAIDPERIAAARNHIGTVFGDAREGVATLWSKTGGTMAFRLAEPGAKDAMAAAAVKASVTTDIYYGVNILGARPAGGGRGSADQVRLVTALVADVDVKPGEANKPQTLAEARAFIGSLPLRPSRITRSGGGFHVYWILDAPYVIASDDDRAEIQTLSGRWSSYVLELAKERGYRLDNIGDLARVLRLDGTINRKHGGAADVTLVEESASRYALSDFLSLLPAEVASTPPVARPTSNQPLRLDAAAVLARARAASNGAKFIALYDRGDLGGHGGDHSAADLGLVNILDFWSDGDPGLIDELFRGSALFRDKWDKKHYADGTTYGAGTIGKARADRPTRLSTPPPRGKPQDAGTPPAELRGDPQDAVIPPAETTDDLPDDVAGLKVIILDLRREVLALRLDNRDLRRGMIAAEQRVDTAALEATEAKHRADTALVRTRELLEEKRKTARILANKHLGSERVTAVALAQQFSTRKPDENGMFRVPLQTLARHAGVSDDAVSTHVKKLEKQGVLRRELKWIPETVDPGTGEIRGGHKAVYVAPADNVTDFAAAVAALVPETPKNWGGARLHCPHHPDAEIEKTTTWACTECGEILDTKIETIRPNPQDAGFLDEDDDELQPTGTDGPRFVGSLPPRGRTKRYRNAPASHNGPLPDGLDTASGAVAAAWFSGSSLRAPDEAPPVVEVF